MTLNYDCIRDVLLYLESSIGYTGNVMSLEHKRLSISSVPDGLPKYSKEDVLYSIEKLEEIKYIRFSTVARDSQKYIVNGYIDDITWEGFNFLNNIREKTIWEATKEGAKKIGAMSVSAISTISFEIVKTIVTNQSIIDKIMEKIHW